MRLFDLSLNLYRKTIKRFRPLHIAVHWFMSHTVIPLLERIKHFKTIPDDPFWFRLELLTNRHESETVRQVDRFLKPGMVALDIGAHVGYYARRFARLVDTEGKVFAFEPHPRIFEVLCSNTDYLDNLTPVRIAVAETDGTAELYDYLMMSASGSLHYDEAIRELQKSQLSASDVAPRIASDFPVEKFSVQTRSIDNFLQERDIKEVHLVKIDIEGAEIGALRGMKNTIANSTQLVLIMEYNPQALTAFDFDPQQALTEVLNLGFNRIQVIEKNGALKDITHDKNILSQLTADLMQNLGVVNLLLTRTIV